MKEDKVIELNTLERLTLLSLLPKEGTFQNLKLLRILKEDLSFNDEENKALQFRQEGGMIMWNNSALRNKETGEIVRAPQEALRLMYDKDPDVFESFQSCPNKSFVFGKTIEEIVVKALKDLDKAGKVTEEHYSLYEKFMEGHEE